MAYLYCLFDPQALVPTEEVDLSRVDDLEAKIRSDGRWTEPITAHKDAYFVMDGHHRLTVARRLRLAFLPVVFLRYDEVRVTAWRKGETITPEDIFAMARSGRLYPIKTTRHIFDPPVSGCDVPLQRLGYVCPQGRSAAHDARPEGRRAVTGRDVTRSRGGNPSACSQRKGTSR